MLLRFAVRVCAVALLTLPVMGQTATATLDQRALPMHFEFRVEGPAAACGKDCRSFVAATGAITADTARDFDAFAKKQNVRGAMLVLDSDGGSVLGALALGRAVRQLQMATMVGRLTDVESPDNAPRRAQLVPRAYCESMCAFVLLAGVERYVPAEARVLVHQIWLGDRRDDPTAANYSAEDLVLVQRDIGRLAQYTIEMGGGIELLEVALKIPPWEPMRQLTRDELRGMKIVTADEVPMAIAVATTSSPPPALASGSRLPVGERSWTIADDSGSRLLTRKHPLTVEGDDIGTFELSFGCGDTKAAYTVSYTERRRVRDVTPGPLTGVELWLSGQPVTLTVVSSRSSGQPVELMSVAQAQVPVELVKGLADLRNRSITVETTNANIATNIRIGNVGVATNFQKLADFCAAREPIRSTELRPQPVVAEHPPR